MKFFASALLLIFLLPSIGLEMKSILFKLKSSNFNTNPHCMLLVLTLPLVYSGGMSVAGGMSILDSGLIVSGGITVI